MRLLSNWFFCTREDGKFRADEFSSWGKGEGYATTAVGDFTFRFGRAFLDHLRWSSSTVSYDRTDHGCCERRERRGHQRGENYCDQHWWSTAPLASFTTPVICPVVGD